MNDMDNSGTDNLSLDNLSLDNFLSTQNLPSVVALGTSATDTIYEGAFGVLKSNSNESVHIDTPHAIMSMTKPITSMAIMRLVEQGKIELDAPAINFIPAYKEIKVLDHVDSANRRFDATDLNHDFTVRELLTHTAGFGYSFCNETLFAFGPEGESAMFPLSHQPGERWTYGISTRLLGEIVAVVNGADLEKSLTDLVFSPLGMSNTSYDVKDDQVYPHSLKDGKWIPGDKFPNMPFGDGGLISTARDYAKLLRCFLQNGEPLLEAQHFRAMTSNQIGDLFITEQPAANPSLTYPFPAGGGVDKFGLGFQLHAQPESGMRSAGSYSWCGMLNTFFWGDPVRKVGGIVLMQVLPLYEPVCLETLSGFEKRFYQLIG
jgi:CubicO group peptidase (beta-lactamase class C family)